MSDTMSDASGETLVVDERLCVPEETFVFSAPSTAPPLPVYLAMASAYRDTCDTKDFKKNTNPFFSAHQLFTRTCKMLVGISRDRPEEYATIEANLLSNDNDRRVSNQAFLDFVSSAEKLHSSPYSSGEKLSAAESSAEHREMSRRLGLVSNKARELTKLHMQLAKYCSSRPRSRQTILTQLDCLSSSLQSMRESTSGAFSKPGLERTGFEVHLETLELQEDSFEDLSPLVDSSETPADDLRSQDVQPLWNAGKTIHGLMGTLEENWGSLLRRIDRQQGAYEALKTFRSTIDSLRAEHVWCLTYVENLATRDEASTSKEASEAADQVKTSGEGSNKASKLLKSLKSKVGADEITAVMKRSADRHKNRIGGDTNQLSQLHSVPVCVVRPRVEG
jgi:hypothetical protein